MKSEQEAGAWPSRRLAGLRLLAAYWVIGLLSAGTVHSLRAEGGGGASPERLSPKPPLFLCGAMAVLLTNVDGFAARVTMETCPSANRVEVVSGELWGRGGKLLFVPQTGKSGGKRSNRGHLSFLWDMATNGGYIFSEALQGYAPISSNVRVTNVAATAATSQAARLQAEGHPCELAEVVVATSDGATANLQVWRATDLKRFPIRMQSEAHATPLTVRFAKIRLEAVPSELFRVPDGFTRYDSAEALMNELGWRQMSTRQRVPEGAGPAEPMSGRGGRRSRGGQ